MVRIPDMVVVVELCSNFFIGWEAASQCMCLSVVPARLFQPLQGSVTPRRCDSTTWDGNRSAYDHARVWHCLLGTPEDKFFLVASRTVPCFPFPPRVSGLFSFFFEISITNSCLQSPNSHQEWLRATFLVVLFCFWVNSCAVCFAVCANSWCTGLQVLVFEAMQNKIFPRGKQT